MMMTTPQHLADMDAIAELFSARYLWNWPGSSAASLADSLHREAWVEEVTTRNPRHHRTARFLNDLDFARLLLGGGRELEISRANLAAYTRHRMQHRAKPRSARRRRQTADTRAHIEAVMREAHD